MFYKLLIIVEHYGSASLSLGNPFELIPNLRTDLRISVTHSREEKSKK